MAIDSIGSDLNKISIKPVTQVGEISANPAIKNLPATSTNSPAIERDGANVNANKGRIPASGSLFSGEIKNSGAEKVIGQYSTDKKQLQSFLSALENVNLADGIGNESDDLMNELLTLGFEMKVENGKIIITDIDSGNEIKPEDFGAIKDNLKNTIKRTISNLDSQGAVSGASSKPSASSLTSASGANKPASVQPQAMMSAAQEQEMLNVLKTSSDTDKQVKEVSAPLKANLDKQIREYEAKMSQAASQSAKIDAGITQIGALKEQAENIINKSKTQGLSETEKKQLLSLSSSIDLKQKEMQGYQQGNEVLLQQVDQVFSQFSDNLSETEKSTKGAMQEALKAKVSGQGLTVRQNFLASISQDIYKITSNMSPDELQKTMADPAARVKLLSSTNKLIDKMSTAKSIKEFNGQELDNLWDKFKIKAVEENGKLSFVYYADKNTQPQTVSATDLKSMRVDINNIVTSPDLFTLARASGQIAIAYDKDLSLKANEIAKGEQPNQQNSGLAKPKSENVKPENAKESTKKYDKPINSTEDTVQSKEAKMLEVRSLDKSMEQRKEEEKYHEKQIKSIYENRREINKHIDTKRNAQIEQEREIKDNNLHSK